jgi:hypothetical protein
MGPEQKYKKGTFSWAFKPGGSQAQIQQKRSAVAVSTLLLFFTVLDLVWHDEIRKPLLCRGKENQGHLHFPNFSYFSLRESQGCETGYGGFCL